MCVCIYVYISACIHADTRICIYTRKNIDAHNPHCTCSAHQKPCGTGGHFWLQSSVDEDGGAHAPRPSLSSKSPPKAEPEPSPDSKTKREWPDKTQSYQNQALSPKRPSSSSERQSRWHWLEAHSWLQISGANCCPRDRASAQTFRTPAMCDTRKLTRSRMHNTADAWSTKDNNGRLINNPLLVLHTTPRLSHCCRMQIRPKDALTSPALNLASNKTSCVKASSTQMQDCKDGTCLPSLS